MFSLRDANGTDGEKPLKTNVFCDFQIPAVSRRRNFGTKDVPTVSEIHFLNPDKKPQAFSLGAFVEEKIQSNA